MLSVKAREATDTIFKVFGMTQLRIVCHASQANGMLISVLVKICPVLNQIYFTLWLTHFFQRDINLTNFNELFGFLVGKNLKLPSIVYY